MEEYKAIRWNIDEAVEVELTFDQPKENFNERFNKTTYWYGIKELINGENGFNATQKLHETIQALNAKKGNKIKIVKVSNGTITFFKVEGQQVVQNDNSTNTTSGQDIILKDVQPEVPLEAKINDLLKRVDAIEHKLAEEKKSNVINEEGIPF
tara:strand:+ start:19 stop:477 length:459 start_codon:yes stop_codon:yes gene_type:complete